MKQLKDSILGNEVFNWIDKELRVKMGIENIKNS